MEEQELTVTLDGSSETIQQERRGVKYLTLIRRKEMYYPPKLILKAEELRLSQTRRLWRSIG